MTQDYAFLFVVCTGLMFLIAGFKRVEVRVWPLPWRKR